MQWVLMKSNPKISTFGGPSYCEISLTIKICKKLASVIVRIRETHSIMNRKWNMKETVDYLVGILNYNL